MLTCSWWYGRAQLSAQISLNKKVLLLLRNSVKATKLTKRQLEENAAPANNQRKYGVSAITADKHLSSCPFLNAFAFSSTTLISFVPRVYSFLAPVLDCNNDLRKQCFFLFSIPGANTDGFIFLCLSRSALPIWCLCFMSSLFSIKICSFHQQQLQPETCQHPILCACVGEAARENFNDFKLEIYNSVEIKTGNYCGWLGAWLSLLLFLAAFNLGG